MTDVPVSCGDSFRWPSGEVSLDMECQLEHGHGGDRYFRDEMRHAEWGSMGETSPRELE